VALLTVEEPGHKEPTARSSAAKKADAAFRFSSEQLPFLRR
jgi:hypothetical protein